MIDDTGARTGRSTCGGSVPLTSASFSDTSWRAMKMSVPQSNSTQTTAMPTAVAERTRRTPDAPLMALSIGNVTSDSISSGAMPCPSARMVTVGAVRSGKHVDRHLPRGPRAGAEQQHREADHHPVVVDRPLNQCVSWRPSVNVAFGGQSLGRRRELNVVGAARDDAFAGLDAARGRRRSRRRATAISMNRRAKLSPPICTNTYGRPASISTASCGTTGMRCVCPV